MSLNLPSLILCLLLSSIPSSCIEEAGKRVFGDCRGKREGRVYLEKCVFFYKGGPFSSGRNVGFKGCLVGYNAHEKSSVVKVRSLPDAATVSNPAQFHQKEAISPSPPASLLQEPKTSARQRQRHHDGLYFFLGVLVLLAISIVLLILLCKFIKLAKCRKILSFTKGDQAPDFLSGNLRNISYFDYRTLKEATQNFHSANLLGIGGFGAVYKGTLEDGTMIAVKKLSLDKSQQGESEFLAEVRTITSIQHKNLVRLVGCCANGSQRLLVYEYMKNKSLDAIVYGKRHLFLDWKTRFQIIIGIARGLQYLHEDSHVRIVHRDIKASNILLDDKLQPKIGDFGLARFFPEDQAYLSTNFAGTLGYTAPEYAIRGELSEKADIYSFGVLILEIISCRKNTDLTYPSGMQYLPEYAWKLFEEAKVVDLVDPKLELNGYVERDVLQTIHVSLLCIQPYPSLRPPMSEIVAMLTCRVENMPVPVMPASCDLKCINDGNRSWDVLSDGFSSPVKSDSLSFPRLASSSPSE